MPTVSAIIPTYNRPEYLVRAAKSVAEQTKHPDELIVVNDGSTRDYSSARDAIQNLPIDTYYFEIEGRGGAGARNYGAAHATGDVLMFLDDDDRWRPSKVEEQLRHFEDGVGVVYSGRIAVAEDGTELYRITGGLSGDLSTEILMNNAIGTTSSPAIRRSLFETVGGFDEDMPGLQDWELWIRLCQETRVAYDPSFTAEWTIHNSESGQMTSQSSRYESAIKRLQQKHSEKLSAMSWKNRRRAKAGQLKSMATKYERAGSKEKYAFIFRSLWMWPSKGAAARLLPSTVLNSVRSVLS